jgi:hypothetical protein
MVTGMDPAKVALAYSVAFALLAVTSTTAVLSFRKISR